MNWEDKQSLKDFYMIAMPIVLGIAAAVGLIAFAVVWLTHLK